MTIALDELRQVQAADVYKQDRLAATLTRSRAGTVLRYIDDYDGPPVASSLPLGGPELLSPAGAVPPFFANLLPEGRRLTAVRAMAKTSFDDELTLLLAVGADTIGDVRVVPAGAPVVDPEPLLTEACEPGEISFADVLERAGFVDRVGLPGVQDKLSAGMITIPMRWADRPLIVKLDPPDYPGAVVNEDYFLRAARRTRQPVVDAEILRDRDDRPGLAVARFDRAVEPDGVLRRYAVEDACQLLGRYPADKYSVSTEEVLAAVADACQARPVALRAAFLQFVLAWATGNGDLHAKNIAVLQRGAEWRVSPIYDIPSTLMWGDDSMALPVGGRVRGLTRRHFVDLGVGAGLPERAVQRVIDDVLAATEPVVEDLRAGGLAVDQDTRTQLARRLQARRRSLALPS